jgi:RNA polymerase sigma-70 factor (ECF subfamily)
VTLKEFDAEAERLQVARAQRDLQAFGPLYDRYVDPVYRYCYRRTRDHPAAEDMTAQTFRRALEGLPRYEWREAPFGAWLFRIARNLLIDQGTKSGRSVSLDGLLEGGFEAAGGGQTPEEEVAACEERDVAWREVRRLPALQRRAVTLYFGREMTHAEVGRVIGRSEGATRQLVFRAVQTLRMRLADTAE